MRLRCHQQELFMDLSKAYQSVILAEELRDYNAFKINDLWVRATRMLFGLSIGHKVLYLVLRYLLAEKSINYRDDVFVPNVNDETDVIQILESPTASGTVERVNRTLLTLMRTAKHMFPTETPTDWVRRAISWGGNPRGNAQGR